MVADPQDQTQTDDDGRRAQMLGRLSAIMAGLTIVVVALAIGTLYLADKDMRSSSNSSTPDMRGLGMAFAIVVIGGLAMIGVTGCALASIVLGVFSARRSRIGNWGDVKWAVAGIALSFFMLACEGILLVFLSWTP